jgi:AcrR family transcriptional regulator
LITHEGKSMMENGTAKRELILEAAIQLLRTKNYDTMKTGMVAKLAGVAEGTIFRYFATKRELFFEAIRRVSRRCAEIFFAGVSPQNTLRGNFEVLAGNFFLRNAESDTLYRIIYKAFSEVEDPETKEILGEIFLLSIGEVKKLLLTSKDAAALESADQKLEFVVMMLWGIGDVFWKRDLIQGRMMTTEAEMRTIIQMLMRMLGLKE